MENKFVGSRLTIMGIKSNDLVMSLAHQRSSLIVHTKGLCPGVGSQGGFLVEVAFEVER